MAEGSQSPSFTPFPRLPVELRLKIWEYVHELTPARLIPFYVCKSDLDYLRSKRPACHNYLHIFAERMKRIPEILHVCRDSRSIGLPHYNVGFDISRILSLGRADTDVDTYTTCSHEVSTDEQNKEMYWNPTRDVMFLESLQWMENKDSAYVWGGKTGVRFGKMRTVAMTYDTLKSCGLGEYLSWEGISTLIILCPQFWSSDDNVGYQTEAERYTHTMLRKAGLSSNEGDGGVEVKVQFRSVEDFVDSFSNL